MNWSQDRQIAQVVTLIAAFAACSCSVANADETKVYEWHEANGVTSYAQHPPPPGTPGVTSRTIDTKHFTPAQRVAVRAQLARTDAAEQADAARFRARVSTADETVSRALRSLSASERAAREGRVPQAGERVGNAGGGSRLRSDYFDRQKQLEDAVQAARDSVDRAYRARASVTP